MAQLAPIQLDDGTVIYIEAEDNVTAPIPPSSEGTTRTPKGPAEVALKNFQAMQSTIRTYTACTLNAFKEMGTANVDKVTLEFGVKVAGEGGECPISPKVAVNVISRSLWSVLFLIERVEQR